MIKIADFGLSFEGTNSVITKQGKIPFRHILILIYLYFLINKNQKIS